MPFILTPSVHILPSASSLSEPRVDLPSEATSGLSLFYLPFSLSLLLICLVSHG